MFFRYIRAEEAKLFQTLDNRVRILIPLLKFAGDGDHFALDELPNAGHDLMLYLVVRVHFSCSWETACTFWKNGRRNSHTLLKNDRNA